MKDSKYHYECTDCGFEVKTQQFREARECGECETGTLANTTIQE